MQVLSELEPKEVFRFFEILSDIPRGSSHEKDVSDWFIAFAREKGYEAFQDDHYNVLIKVPGSEGYEKSEPVILHGHMDMVCKSEIGVQHDFLHEGLKLYIEDGYIRAEGTTLGADNGIGIAYFLAIIDQNDIPHPPLELALTAMEEMGKVGGNAFDTSKLSGKKMIDLNWHKDDHILAGCSGDVSVKFQVTIETEPIQDEAKVFELNIEGLLGGHCEFDIVLERANSIKLLARCLDRMIEASEDVRFCEVSGGVQNNVIPSEACALVAIKEADVPVVLEALNEVIREIKEEYSVTDPDISICLRPVVKPLKEVFSKKMALTWIRSIRLLPNGVISRSFKIPSIHECSANIGLMTTDREAVTVVSTITSAVTTRKHEVVRDILALAELGRPLTSAEQFGTDAPEWIYNPDSKMLAAAVTAYQNVTGEDPQIEVMPASLELGLFQDRIPGLDIVSIGTKTNGVHTPSEELEIASVGKVWNIFKEVMKNLK